MAGHIYGFPDNSVQKSTDLHAHVGRGMDAHLNQRPTTHSRSMWVYTDSEGYERLFHSRREAIARQAADNGDHATKAVPKHWHLVNGNTGDESVWEFKEDAVDAQREMQEDGYRAHVRYCRTPADCPVWHANRAGHPRSRAAVRAARRRAR